MSSHNSNNYMGRLAGSHSARLHSQRVATGPGFPAFVEGLRYE